MQNYDSANTWKAQWRALENKGAGTPQWKFEKSIYNSEPQFIELEYELTNKDSNARKVTVRFVPTGSANWSIQEIRVNLLDLRFNQ